jgi:alpha-tubulin suppressor-like RCC1 family protein
MHQSALRSLLTLAVGFLVVSAVLDAGPGAGGGNVHTALLMPDGTVWSAGGNSNGEIGDGTTQTRLARVQVLAGASSLAVGANHSLAVVGSQVYGWGHGGFGQLGDPAAVGRSAPTVSPVLVDVVKVAAGATFSLALHSDGTVHVFGNNGSNGIGDGTTLQRTTPVLVSGLTDAIAIAAGVDHALAVRANGSVVAWGSNQFGKLGDGTTTARFAPVAVSGLANIVAVAAAQDSSLALDASGNVWAWGSGFYGVLGRGTTANSSTPIQIPNLSGVTAIAAGRSHAAALVGTAVWTWGLNSSGQLGVGMSPSTSLVPVQVPGLNVIGGIGAAQNATFAFAADSGVWGWGDGVGLGDGTTERRYTPIVLAEGGGLWKVATPQFSVPGGNRSTPATVVLTSVTPGATVRYTTNGAIPTESDAPAPIGGVVVDQTLTLTARAFKAGMPASNAAAATYSFSVLSPTVSPGTGTYTTAQSVTLTNQTSGATVRYTVDGSEPTLASAEPSGTIPIATQTTLKAKAFRSGWSASSTAAASYYFSYGTLPTPTATPGGGSYTTDQTVTLALPGGPGGAAIRFTLDGSIPGPSSTLYTGPITVGTTATLKAKAFHPDYTAGGVLSASYTLSVETPTFTQASGTYAAGTVVAIATNTANATIRYTLNGATPTTNDPILAPGTTLTLGAYTLKAAAWRTGFTASGVATAVYDVTGDVTSTRVAAGGTHTLAVRRDGTLWATGNNGWGMLGDASTTNRLTPVMVTGLTGIKGAAAGASHSLAVGLDGRLYAWGFNTSRQLGDGTSVTYRAVPTVISGVPAMVAVAAGTSHSLALTSTGDVYAWGGNGSGQVGNGTQTMATVPVLVAGLANVVGIAAGDTHSLAWTASGALYAWGGNGNSQLGDGTTTMRTSPVLVTGITGVAEAAAGTSHSVARTTSGQLRAWGRNYEGQLGDATNTNRSTPTIVPSLAGVQVIAAGANHSLASTGSNTFAWGANANSQVGDGSTANRNAPVSLGSLGASVGLGAGTAHSVAVDTAGLVWTWGSGGVGQLGNGTTTTQGTPAPISGGGQTWGVAEPTATPASGTYDAGQAVTLTSVTPGATIRYTTNGVDPTDTDAVASGAITITQTTTLKARAWKTGLTASAVRTFTYTLQLGLPTIAPAGGTYTTAQTISLSPPPSHAVATMRYTLDGTEPGESSTAYAAPFAVPSTATVKVRAFQPGWTPSDVASAAFVIDQTAPTITARVRPGVNPAGWTMAPATVTFICTDAEGPTQGCPSPISVLEETASHPYSATVTDGAGYTATVSGIVKVDLTPPAVSLTGPEDGATVSSPSISISGTASDALSGLATVRCNDAPATVSNGVVACDVPLRPGRNAIVIQASDIAGHSSSVGVTVFRTAPTPTLVVSPTALTMAVGQEYELRAVDGAGLPASSAVWSSSDPLVAEIAADKPVLQALAPGAATISATSGGLAATISLTVVGAIGDLPPDAPLQQVAPLQGFEVMSVIHTHQIEANAPDTVLVEYRTESLELVLRGTTKGATTSITGLGTDLVIEKAIGDVFGGVLMLRADRTTLDRRAFGPSTEPWRYVSPGRLSELAQSKDGTVFAVEQDPHVGEFVVIIDGATGSVRGRVEVPPSTRHFSCDSALDDLSPAAVNGVVNEHGKYGLLVTRGDTVGDCLGGSQGTSETFVLLVAPDASSTRLAVDSASWTGFCDGFLSCSGSGQHTYMGRIVPIVGKGFLVAWRRATPAPPVTYTQHSAIVAPSAGQPPHTITAAPPVTEADLEGALISADGLLVVARQTSTDAYDLESSLPVWSAPIGNAAPVAAYDSSGAVLLQNETLLAVSGNGTVVESSPSPPTPVFVGSEGNWRGVLDGSFRRFRGVDGAEPNWLPLVGSFQGTTSPNVCHMWRQRFPALEQPVTFVVPQSPTLFGWEPKIFQQAVAEWQRIVRKHRPAVTFTTAGAPAASGHNVSVTIDTSIGSSGEASREAGSPWWIKLNPNNYSIQTTDGRPAEYERFVRFLYSHEIGHIVGLGDILEDVRLILMGHVHYGGVYNGVVGGPTCAELTGVRKMYGSSNP